MFEIENIPEEVETLGIEEIKLNDTLDILNNIAAREHAITYPEVYSLDKENFKNFMDRYGYNKTHTQVYRISKNKFGLITNLGGSSEIIEIIKFFDFEESMESLNITSNRVSCDGIYINTGNRKFKIVGSKVEEYVFILFNTKNWQNYSSLEISKYRKEIDGLNVTPLGSLDKSKLSPFHFFHELWHMRNTDKFDNIVEEEIAASQYAISVILFFRKTGINLYKSDINDLINYAEAKVETYIEKSLNKKQRYLRKVKKLFK